MKISARNGIFGRGSSYLWVLLVDLIIIFSYRCELLNSLVVFLRDGRQRRVLFSLLLALSS